MDEEDLPVDAEQSLPDPEEKRDDVRAEHEEIIGELAPEAPDAVGGLVEHDKILEELSGALDEPTDSPVEEVGSAADVAEPTAPTPREVKDSGRYYVPPKERTYKNREERRAEHDRLMGEAEQPATYEDFLREGGEPPDAGQPDMPQFAETVTRGMEQQGSILLDLMRRLDEVAQTLERGRL